MHRIISCHEKIPPYTGNQKQQSADKVTSDNLKNWDLNNATQDESHFKDAAMSAKYWAKLCLRIFMLWSGGFHRFSMICSMTQDGRQFFNHCQTVNTTSFLEHMDKVYREVGKMVLILDKAPWHTSQEAERFFAERDIIVLWYPIGHPYLNPVEEVWSVL